MKKSIILITSSLMLFLIILTGLYNVTGRFAINSEISTGVSSGVQTSEINDGSTSESSSDYISPNNANSLDNNISQNNSNAQDNVNALDNTSPLNNASSPNNTNSLNVIDPYEPKINVSTGYDEGLTGKNLFLTIDDGPSMNNTPKVLETLKKYNVKATFFVCGPDSLALRDLIKQEFLDGHSIGIHCYSHRLRTLYASEESFWTDFNKIETIVKEVTGKTPNLYRFPGGTDNSYVSKDLSHKIIIKLKERGYEYHDWNVSSFDSASPPAQQIADNVINQCNKRIGNAGASIILIHDSASRVESANSMELFLLELKNKGYYFAPLTNAIKPVHFYKK